MEYATFTAVIVVVAFISFCVGVRMGSAYVAKRMVEEFSK
jgi:hypothetical protein